MEKNIDSTIKDNKKIIQEKIAQKKKETDDLIAITI